MKRACSPCVWLLGSVPASLTAMPDEVYVRGSQCICTATGLWESFRSLDASQFYFRTDGSGGLISCEPRLRLCAWSVVAIRRVAPFDVQATLGGPLPGYEQTVPRVEAHAIKMLFQCTTAAVELCSDSQLCVRRLGKVRKQTYETLEHLNNLSVGSGMLDISPWKFWPFLGQNKRFRAHLCSSIHK